jgi:uncharacterized protein (TIGR03086 family)
MPVDIQPATDRMAELIRAVPDDALTAPTPCDIDLATLLDHVRTFAMAFTAAARRDTDPFNGRPPAPDPANLGDDWRERLPRALDELAAAWRSPDAWTGMTSAGGLDLPGEMAGTIALDEVVVHGWDVARAIGQPYDAEPQLLDEIYGWVAQFADPGSPLPREGLFGPPVAVPADAPLLDRVLGLTGRDPNWSAAASAS